IALYHVAVARLQDDASRINVQARTIVRDCISAYQVIRAVGRLTCRVVQIAQPNALVIVSQRVTLDRGARVIRPFKSPEALVPWTVVYEDAGSVSVGARVLVIGHSVPLDVGRRAVPDLDAILGNTDVGAVARYRIVCDFHHRTGFFAVIPNLPHSG